MANGKVWSGPAAPCAPGTKEQRRVIMMITRKTVPIARRAISFLHFLYVLIQG